MTFKRLLEGCKIGLYKYCHQHGMDVHNGASMLIGRRSYKLTEKYQRY